MKKYSSVKFDNHLAVFKAAESFYFVSMHIHHNLAKPMFFDNQNYAFNLLATDITNHALALELYFKCLASISSKEIAYTHHLKYLFDLLPSEYQEKIRKYHDEICSLPQEKAVHEHLERETGKKINNDVDNILEEANDSFITFRYIFEGKGNKNCRISSIIEATRKLIFELYPNWPRLVKVKYA